MLRFILAGIALLFSCTLTLAQDRAMQDILQEQAALIMESSRTSIAPAIAAIADSGLPQAQVVLQTWQAKKMWRRVADGVFFRVEKAEDGNYTLIDLDSGEQAGSAKKSDIDQIKPNSGIRALLGSALVQFQLQDPDPRRRWAALTSIQRNPAADLLAPLRASIPMEDDPELKAMKQRAERLLTIAYDPDESSRIAAIDQMSRDIGLWLTIH